MNMHSPFKTRHVVHEDVASAIRIIDIEVRIINALLEHSERVGHDYEIDGWQAYRVAEAITELKAMVEEVAE